MQISDANQELLPIWSEDKGSKYVGFLPADSDYVRVGKLRAFLSGGFLLPRDYGVDVRVVKADAANKELRFQWKLSTQKVRAPRAPPPCTQFPPRPHPPPPPPPPSRRLTTPR